MIGRTSDIRILYKTWLVAIGILTTSISYAQEEEVTQLDEVEVVANEISKFGAGASISTLDSTIIGNYEQVSIATLLSSQSTLFIKQYGQGMLASASFRGTGAGHTLVQWNGLQVGYPFLGQSDFSVMPLAFTNQIVLLHGASSARYGTGAIGGSIHLKNNTPVDGLHVGLNQSVGSFATSNTSFELSNSGDKGFILVRGLHTFSKNDFPVRSTSGISIGRQINAGYSIRGGLIEGKYFLNPSTWMHLNIQSTYTDRDLQPAIGSTANDHQYDTNFWTSLAFTHQFRSGEVTARYGYLFDKIDFNGNATVSYQQVGDISLSNDLTNWLITEIGINTRWVDVRSPYYTGSKSNELRSGIYASATAEITRALKSSINLRQTFNTGYTIPFTPSIGVEYSVLHNTKWELGISGQLAKGYKVPTLNDRFWVPGGNPDLEPEESLNAEFGIHLSKHEDQPIWLDLTGYKMWVNNWILWLPQGTFWSPENKRKVEGEGIELELGTKKNIGDLHTKYWVNYAFTKSTNMEALDAYDRSAGKQLPYVPLHNGNVNVLFSIKSWSIYANTVFTGKRYTTTDNENAVPGYVLVNAGISKNFNLNSWDLRAYLNLNNITNTNYQSVNNRAMPGINVQAGAKINFHTINKTK